MSGLDEFRKMVLEISKNENKKLDEIKEFYDKFHNKQLFFLELEEIDCDGYGNNLRYDYFLLDKEPNQEQIEAMQKIAKSLISSNGNFDSSSVELSNLVGEYLKNEGFTIIPCWIKTVEIKE